MHVEMYGTIVAICPNCKNGAVGEAKITELFGYRTCDEKPQSWCRKCRSYASHKAAATRKERVLNK